MKKIVALMILMMLLFSVSAENEIEIGFTYVSEIEAMIQGIYEYYGGYVDIQKLIQQENEDNSIWYDEQTETDEDANELELTEYVFRDGEWVPVPTHHYGEKWAVIQAEKAQVGFTDGLVSAMYFLDAMQFTEEELAGTAYEDFVLNKNFVFFSLFELSSDAIMTDFEEGFQLEFSGGVIVKFYTAEEGSVLFARLIAKDIRDANDIPMEIEFTF
ncbi:MAG: hypothetical protein IJB25_11260 [Clostridia bacterium]|nr:hypothetical protein [Clostridia bacterium]